MQQSNHGIVTVHTTLKFSCQYLASLSKGYCHVKYATNAMLMMVSTLFVLVMLCHCAGAGVAEGAS